MSLDKKKALRELKSIKRELVHLKKSASKMEKTAQVDDLKVSPSKIRLDSRNFEVVKDIRDCFELQSSTLYDEDGDRFEVKAELSIYYAMYAHTQFYYDHEETMDKIEGVYLPAKVAYETEVDVEEEDSDGLVYIEAHVDTITSFSVKIPRKVLSILSDGRVPEVFGIKSEKKGGEIFHVDLISGYASLLLPEYNPNDTLPKTVYGVFDKVLNKNLEDLS